MTPAKDNQRALNYHDATDLLRGKAETLSLWINHWKSTQFFLSIAVIILGSAGYGAAMGYWRSPLQSFYAAVKLPLAILLTTGGNALLNAMLAPLLGLNLKFRESLL